MADQQIGTDADEFPEDEHHDEIVRENDAEHREHEEGERSEVAGLAGVVLHVAERVDVDERADAGDEHEHGLAQIVEDQSQRHVENGAEIDPGQLERPHVRRGENDDSCRRNPRTAATEMKLLRPRVRFREQHDHDRREERQEQKIPGKALLIGSR